MDKVDLQSAGISQREKALEREKEFRSAVTHIADPGKANANSDIRAALAAGGASPEIQQKIGEIQERNVRLDEEVKSLAARLEAKNVRLSPCPLTTR